MYKLEILNLLSHKVFEKWFYSEEGLKKFKRKCKYSKKVKILTILDYSKC